ncbi:tyrosine-type recombinase/integrase [Sulfurimonas sp. SAG-AH-194-I05]|nr:tyrosine-type recombinase/integrase [Sulfurimonas sp. SAG-AH-194-I05]MDF1875005.1 tyrosine-type recombinase/integrase [Sulfurimonas sp. SAG-AH-194-I05]
MSRIHKLEKTSKPNIYKIEKSKTDIEYLATFTIKGRRFIEKNLTSLYGVTTIKSAVSKLEKLKTMIREGEDPFFELEKSDISFRDMVIEELENRDIAETTRRSQLTSFKKNGYPLFKNLHIEEIDISSLEKILKKLSETVNHDVLIIIKKAISPTLNSSFEKGIIPINPLNTKTIKDIKGTITSKDPLSHRLNAPLNKNIYKDTIRLMYKSINDFTNIGTIPTNEIKLSLLWALMTARRRSEILKVEYKDIIGNVVKTRSETTKTKVNEFYPLPIEIIELLDKNGKGKVFKNVSSNVYSKYMKKCIKDAGIDTNSISGHDTRNLFLTIMSKKTKNPFLCDMCLSHNKKDYKMLIKYYTPDLEDFRKVFNSYWKIMRK